MRAGLGLDLGGVDSGLEGEAAIDFVALPISRALGPVFHRFPGSSRGWNTFCGWGGGGGLCGGVWAMASGVCAA